MRNSLFLRWRHVIAVAVGVGGTSTVAFASVSWEPFDNLFKRSQGWKMSDGAYSVPLPRVPGTTAARTMWIFGDTIVWNRGVAQPGSSTQTGALGDGNWTYLIGNTMAISTSPTSNAFDPPTGSGIEFYAREGYPCHDDLYTGCSCGGTPDQWQLPMPNSAGPGCPIMRITSSGGVPSTTSRWRGFIPPHTDGAGTNGDLHGSGPPDNGPNGTPDGEMVWPYGGVLVDDATYPALDPYTQQAYVPPDAFAAYPMPGPPPKFLAIGYGIGNFQGGYPDFHENAFLIVAGIENSNPANWNYLSNTSLTRSGDPVNPGSATLFHLSWGGASVHAPGDDKIRIYGLRDPLIRGGSGACPTQPSQYTNVWMCPRTGAQAADAVLAVAWPPTDIADYNRWYFAYTDHPAPGGVAHPCQDLGLPSPCFGRRPPHTPGYVSALTPVARDVPSEFSVSWVTHTEAGTGGRASVSSSAFVMVHGSSYGDVNLDPNTGGPLTTGTLFGVPVVRTGDNPFIPNGRVLVVRTTLDDTAWPDGTTSGSWPSPCSNPPPPGGCISQQISTRKEDQIWYWDSYMLGGPINGVDTLPYGRTVRAVKGHGDLSPDGQMVVSWVIDQDWAPQPVTTVNLWQNSPFTESNRKSPIRFGMYPLSRVQPWCNATGTCP